MKNTAMKTSQKQTDMACDFLRRQIKSGQISTDGMIPSVRKLAEQTGLQRNTLWRALLHLKETRFVVTTQSGRYTVHPRFRLNRKGSKTLRTAFVGPENIAVKAPFVQRVYNALENNQEGFNIELSILTGSDEKKVPVKKLEEYDAVILTASWNLPYMGELKKKGVPVTALLAPNHYHLPCVVKVDNFHGGEIAGRIFGVSQIKNAVLLGESLYYPEKWHEDFELRVIGFRRSWLQLGRNTGDIIEHPLPIDLLPRLRCIEEIVSCQKEPTEYFALSDSTGIILLGVLKERGIRIPQDALIIGFDDSPESETSGLSSFHVDPYLMAESLVLQLRTQEYEKDYSETIYIKPRLVERNSSISR